MSATTIPAIIRKLRDLDTGASEGMFSDFSTSQLDYAARWCLNNGDSSLLVAIDDELAFRYS